MSLCDSVISLLKEIWFLPWGYQQTGIFISRYLPSAMLKFFTVAFSAIESLVACILQKTGSGKYHIILDVNPLTLFCTSSMMGSAVCGWVNPNIVNDVWVILKFAFPVTKQIIFFYIRFLHFLYNFCIWLIIAGVWSNGSKAGSLLKWHYLFGVFLFVVECSFSLWFT